MSKPLVTFPDPEAAVVNYLTEQLAFRIEDYAPATVEVGFPAVPLADLYAQVELELGAAEDYPIAERAQVRVTCWAPSGRRSDVKDCASLMQGLLYTHPGDMDVAGVTIPLGRSDVVKDPDTGYLMCWFLARVSLKPNVLSTS